MTCGTCRHWKPLADDPGWGRCDADQTVKAKIAATVLVKNAVRDVHLRTTPAFGCVSHEDKPGRPATTM